MKKDKVIWKPGTMLYPLPAVMVSCGSKKEEYNIITISWTGTVCSDPAMLSISVRPERYSYEIIKKNGEFVVNLTTKRDVRALDFCGVKSGREVDKFKKMGLTSVKGEKVSAPIIKESPVNIECQLERIEKLGTHDLFIARVVCVQADKKYLDQKGAFNLKKAELICYSHGKYYQLGKEIGYFGFSVAKKKTQKRKAKG